MRPISALQEDLVVAILAMHAKTFAQAGGCGEVFLEQDLVQSTAKAPWDSLRYVVKI